MGRIRRVAVNRVIADGETVSPCVLEIEDGKLTVDGDNARVEIYNASGSKVYDGAGRGVSLDGFVHGLFILKVYGEDGTSETRKLMF